MKQIKLSYATGKANAANGTTRNDAELAENIIKGIEVIGSTIRDIYAKGAEAIQLLQTRYQQERQSRLHHCSGYRNTRTDCIQVV